jgi:hypothetical protein
MATNFRLMWDILGLLFFSGAILTALVVVSTSNQFRRHASPHRMPVERNSSKKVPSARKSYHFENPLEHAP